MELLLPPPLDEPVDAGAFVVVDDEPEGLSDDVDEPPDEAAEPAESEEPLDGASFVLEVLPAPDFSEERLSVR